jgi:hypothetical protein
MSLTSLAVITDLPSTQQGSPFAQTGIAVASAFIREAAGCPITAETATLTLDGGHEPLLRLPVPFSNVTGVVLDGTALEAPWGYRIVQDGLYRAHGWLGFFPGPAPVLVTCTYGYPNVPAEIKDMVVQRAINYIKHMEAGGGSQEGIANVQVDDGREEYTADYANRSHPCYVSEATRTWLARRFGGGPTVVLSTSWGNW